MLKRKFLCVPDIDWVPIFFSGHFFSYFRPRHFFSTVFEILPFFSNSFPSLLINDIFSITILLPVLILLAIFLHLVFFLLLFLFLLFLFLLILFIFFVFLFLFLFLFLLFFFSVFFFFPLLLLLLLMLSSSLLFFLFLLYFSHLHPPPPPPPHRHHHHHHHHLPFFFSTVYGTEPICLAHVAFTFTSLLAPLTPSHHFMATNRFPKPMLPFSNSA